MISSKILIEKLKDNQSNAKSLSLITLGQNAIWNCYGCLINCYFCVCSVHEKIYFIIPAILLFICFSVFEMRLVLTLWRIKNITLLGNHEMVKIKLFRFYLVICNIFFSRYIYTLRSNLCNKNIL